MAIISESNRGGYTNTQFRYGLIYICITLVVLVFLNVYCLKISQRLFYQSKETSMIEKSKLAAAEISNLDVLNYNNVSAALSSMEDLPVTRLLVTDSSGLTIYDSSQESAMGSFALLPEIVDAIRGNDVFSWSYHEGSMDSRCATPVVSYGSIIGCVYMTESDPDQGALIQTLQKNIFAATVVLEIVVIAFSLAFSRAFSTRFRRILASMQIIRKGDYSHKVNLGGKDELAFLGAEFNELTKKLQESENKRSQFVSDASHELKTPLAAIKLLSDSILQNEMDPQTIREFVGDIGSEADRLNRMSQKLLSLTHIEGQQDGDCEIVYLSPTVERVVRMLSPIAEENNISIELDLAGDSPILILEDDLYQITFNLVENGIKYNMPGGKLSIRLFRDVENAYLQVSDTGMGIPKEAVSHVFERFYRVDKARSRSSGGSGLGLAIVKNMVERNQGNIRVDSTLGQGTTFTVSFPIFDLEENAP